MFKVLKRLLILVIFWILVWAPLGLLLKPQGYNYVANPTFFAAYFAFAVVLLYIFAKKEIEKKISHFKTRDVFIILSVYIISLLIIILTRGRVGENALLHVDLRMDELFWLSPKYFFAKSFEIIFQQAFFVVSLGYLLRSPLSTNKEILLFGVYALFIHLPVFLFLSPIFALFICLSALLSGIVFAFAITHFKDGFVYSFSAHLLFYALISSLYWLA